MSFWDKLLRRDSQVEIDAQVSKALEEKGYSEDWLRSIDLSKGGSDKITNVYSQSYVVYKAISAIAENIPQAIFKIYQKGSLEPVGLDDPLSILFNKPNKHMSRFELWEQTSTYLNLYGECMWYLAPAVGRKIPAEIQVINPTKMKHSVNNDGELEGWVYNGKEDVPFTTDEIIHYKLFNPYNTIRGMSPVQAAQLEIDSDFYAATHNKAFFENDAVPPAVIEVDKDKDVKAADVRRLLKQWEAGHKGPNKAGKIGILQGGMSIKTISPTQSDMDYIEGRKLSRENILAVFGVPKSIAGFTDGVQKATAFAAKRQFWHEKLKPQLMRVQEKLLAEFFMIYAPGYYGKFDYSGIDELKRDYNELLESATQLFSIGYTRNELNQRLDLGMSEDDTGDVRYLPINLVPVDDIGMELEVEEVEPKSESVSIEEKSDSEEKINRYRRIFLSQQRAQEGRFHKKVKAYIKKQRDKVIPLLIDGGKKSIETAEILEQIATIWDDEYARAMTVFTPLIGDSMEVGGRLALSNLGIEREYETARDVVKLRTNRLATNMNETTWKSLRKTIYTGVSEGETINQITDRVKEVYNVRTTSARRIARTEVTGAVNEATFDEYQKVGVQMKQWVGGERETHVENASVGPIPMGAVFPNGQQYPGDPAGGASEVINCRCTLAPIVGE